MMSKKTSYWLLGVGILVLVVVVGWIYRVDIKEGVINVGEEELPTPVSYEAVKEELASPRPKPSVSVKSPAVSEMAEVNLAVPFAPQAPHANWDQPYQDACEEAAVIMVARYITGKSLNADIMDREILKMVAWEEKNLGFYIDTNVAETARLVHDYYPGLQARASYDITVLDIITELQSGNAVVVLANGQTLGNPYYTAPGPEKHALVIRGYTNGKFITNDPGTKRGEGYVYTTQQLFKAIVDYDGGKPGTGKKAMIVITNLR